jgi:hypothetical protein
MTSEYGVKLYDSPNSTTHASMSGYCNQLLYQWWDRWSKSGGNLIAGKVTGIINENSITGNSGYAINATTITNNVAATCNWYGTNTVAGVAAKINGLVTYEPWLNDGSDIGDPGFVPGGTCTGATNLYVNDWFSI